MSATKTRMTGDERRAAILGAATRAFARAGYHGTSTDAVAREAGVSQPYVVRMFGTKLELFLAVFERSAERIRTTFEEVLDAGPFDPASEEDRLRLGLAYTELLRDRELLEVQMHGFSSGGVPEIGAAARRCMAEIFATIKRTGWSAEECRGFVAHGMLINVMLAMDAPEHLRPGDPLEELAACAFGDALELLESPS